MEVCCCRFFWSWQNSGDCWVKPNKSKDTSPLSSSNAAANRWSLWGIVLATDADVVGCAGALAATDGAVCGDHTRSLAGGDRRKRLGLGVVSSIVPGGQRAHRGGSAISGWRLVLRLRRGAHKLLHLWSTSTASSLLLHLVVRPIVSGSQRATGAGSAACAASSSRHQRWCWLTA